MLAPLGGSLHILCPEYSISNTYRAPASSFWCGIWGTIFDADLAGSSRGLEQIPRLLLDEFAGAGLTPKSRSSCRNALAALRVRGKPHTSA
jgi:hypothetical protein